MKRKLKTLEQLKKEFKIKEKLTSIYFIDIKWRLPQDIYSLFGKEVTIKSEMESFRGINYYEIKESLRTFPVIWFEDYKFIEDEEFSI